MKILVTGATGYIGGRLVRELLAAGYDVRAMTRTAGWLRDAPWAGQVETVTADALDPASLAPAMREVDVVYYLIHSLATGADFEQRDARAARNVAAAARAAGVRRIVYLGGMGDEGNLSPHLRSRHEVGDILLESGVPTAVLQAGVIIGSGSASFEMLRYLTERLPAMVTPVWVRTRIQPIAVQDVLRYLVGCTALPDTVSRRFDIGGPDVLTYEEMMQRYAAVAALNRRVILPVPVLSPRLSSLWVGLVTPVPSAIARPLVESLRNEVVCREHDIAAYVPDPPQGLVGFDEACRLALQRVREAQVATRWSDAEWPGAPSDPLPTDPDWAGGSLYRDEHRLAVDVPRETLWRVVEGIGGDAGWYSFPLAWQVRGWLDRAVGGVGLRRGRRNPAVVHVGEALDFWRVEEVVPGRLLRLRAEMRLPGLAWLEFRLEDDPDRSGSAILVQRALFYPRGLAGHAYWTSMLPFHAVIFGAMARNIAAAAGAAPRRADEARRRSASPKRPPEPKPEPAPRGAPADEDAGQRA